MGARGCPPVQVTARALGDPSFSPRVALPPHTPTAGSSPTTKQLVLIQVFYLSPHLACNPPPHNSPKLFPYPFHQGDHPLH